MSEFIALSTRLKLKLDTPKGVLDFLDTIYGIDDKKFDLAGTTLDFPFYTAGDAVKELKADLKTCSAFFPAWGWRVREQTADAWVYESYSSCREDDNMVSLNLLVNDLRPYMVSAIGDILYRMVYPHAVRETVVYFDDTGTSVDDGYEYERDVEGALCDNKHPQIYQFREGIRLGYLTGRLPRCERPPVDDFPQLPWTLQELDSATQSLNLPLQSTVIVKELA